MGGDFNAVLASEDRDQGNPVTLAEIEDFKKCLQENELEEVRAVGALFTWTNNQMGERRICSNIDRCFANSAWFFEFSGVVVERLEKGISDHCPQLLTLGEPRRRNGMFRFYNVLVEHVEFEQLVRQNWGQNTSHSRLWDVWMKCQSLKVPLKQLNTQWFRRTTEKVEGIRTQLQFIQQKLVTYKEQNIIQEEKRLLEELEKWSGIEEKLWCQKSRVDWLKLGDFNTKFFHAYAKMRQNLNGIHRLERPDESICIGQESIMHEIREFYRGLMGTAAKELTMVDKLVMERGPKLQPSQQQFLTLDCTAQKVKDALFGMDSNKAPGIDSIMFVSLRRGGAFLEKR